MKKSVNIIFLLSVFLFSFCSYTGLGQGFYVTGGVGYGFKAASQTVDDNLSATYSYFPTSSDSSYSDEAVKGSFGKGFCYNASFGYMFSENIGMELGVSYLSGGNINSTYEYRVNVDYGFGGTLAYTHTMTSATSGSMVRLTPTIKLQTGKGAIKPYMKTGLVIGLGTSVESTHQSDYNYALRFPTHNYDTLATETDKYSQGGSMGFTFAMGADIQMSDIMSLYCELGMTGQTWAPKQYDVTSFSKNGTDAMSSLTAYQKQTIFTDKYTMFTYSGGWNNKDAPRQALTTYLPFSSWGINVGVHLWLKPHQVSHS